jgi:hypothetical protein
VLPVSLNSLLPTNQRREFSVRPSRPQRSPVETKRSTSEPLCREFGWADMRMPPHYRSAARPDSSRNPCPTPAEASVVTCPTPPAPLTEASWHRPDLNVGIRLPRAGHSLWWSVVPLGGVRALSLAVRRTGPGCCVWFHAHTQCAVLWSQSGLLLEACQINPAHACGHRRCPYKKWGAGTPATAPLRRSVRSSQRLHVLFYIGGDPVPATENDPVQFSMVALVELTRFCVGKRRTWVKSALFYKCQALILGHMLPFFQGAIEHERGLFHDEPDCQLRRGKA